MTKQMWLGTWPDLAAARSFLQRLVVLAAGGDTLLEVSPDVEDRLAEWLQENELGPLAYHHRLTISPAAGHFLQSDWFSAVAEGTLRAEHLQCMHHAFVEAHIPFVLLKGAALALSVYRDDLSRVMSDIDLWVQEEKLPQVIAIMHQLGYEWMDKSERPLPLQQLSGGEIRFHHPAWAGVLIELHWQPLKGWWLVRTANIDNGVIWSRIEPLVFTNASVFSDGEEGIYQLSAEDMVIHLAVHLAINHQFGLSAIRHLLDIALTERVRGVDWLSVAARAKDWRVATAVYTTLNLLDQLIGVEGLAVALVALRPSRLRRKLVRRYVSAESVLAGRDLRHGWRRFVLLLLLVDRFRDMLTLIFRTLWPEPEWLEARYGGNVGHWQHLWQVLRYGQI